MAALGFPVCGHFRGRSGLGYVEGCWAWLFRALVRLWLRWDILSVAVRGCAMPLAALGFPVRGHFEMRLGYGYAGEILCRAISGCAPVLDTLRGTGAWLFREAACGWPRWSALCVAISGCVPVWPRWGASIVTMRVRKRGRHMRRRAGNGTRERRLRIWPCVHPRIRPHIHPCARPHICHTSARSAHALPDLPAAYPSGIHTELALK